MRGAGGEELIHCARRKADTADPAKIPLEFLLFTHTGHVLFILTAKIVADGHDSGVCALVFMSLGPGRHRGLA